jgi:hypothetical protein
MSTDKQIHMLDELQSLLEKQIELAQQGNPASRRIEVLSEQADSLVGKIANTGILELSEFKHRRELLHELYDRLRLAIMTQKAETAERLSRVHQGRKTIGTYRSNI